MHLLRNLELAQKEGFVFGVKLVRGAYHTQESTRQSPYEPDVTAIKGYLAEQSTEGFPQQQSGPKPPVWDEKYETDAAYDAAASLLLDLVRRPDARVGPNSLRCLVNTEMLILGRWEFSSARTTAVAVSASSMDWCPGVSRQ